MERDPYFLNPRRVKCARCGEVAKGSASINGERYCHSDDPYPTCYMLASYEQTRQREFAGVSDETRRFLRDFMDANDEVLRRLADC